MQNLQEKFKMQRGILPKGADLPGLATDTKFDEQQIKENAKLKADRKGQSYSLPLVDVCVCRARKTRVSGKKCVRSFRSCSSR